MGGLAAKLENFRRGKARGDVGSFLTASRNLLMDRDLSALPPEAVALVKGC
jgi:hypothetical protein